LWSCGSGSVPGTAWLWCGLAGDAGRRKRARQRDDPDAFITNPAVFGNLAEDQRFLDAYRSVLASLHQRGARAALAWLATWV
jgi:mannitol-1-phosphate/altronate dehydrogenase